MFISTIISVSSVWTRAETVRGGEGTVDRDTAASKLLDRELFV